MKKPMTEAEVLAEIRRYARDNALGNIPIKTHQPGCITATDPNACDCEPTWDALDGKPPGGAA